MIATIRSVRPDDKARWLELWAAYLAFYDVSHLDPAITARNWDVIVSGKGPFHGLVATDGADRPLAIVNYLLHPYTWGLGNACYLEDLFVADEARGMGAGRRIMDHLIALGRDKGWTRLYWNTQESNQRARALYDSYTPANDYVQYKLPIGIE